MPLVGVTVTNDTLTLNTPSVITVPVITPSVIVVTVVSSPPPPVYLYSTVFTKNVDSVISENLAPLTTIWPTPATCRDRWMLSRPDLVTEDGQSKETLLAISTYPTNPHEPFDRLYISCQPYSVTMFSPGVCPEGRTIAEITLYQYSDASATRSLEFYQASCCPSGMTFGVEVGQKCVSDITRPLKAFDLFTTRPDGEDGTVIVEYEYSTSEFLGYSFGEDGYSTNYFSNTTTITSGIAIADPIVVGWQMSDLPSFPRDYAASLAQKIGTTAAPASSSTLPRQTGTFPHTPADGLGTGVKTGIGIGTALGALLISSAITFFFWWRKRRIIAAAPRSVHVAEMEDQDQVLAGKKWYLFGRWRNEHAGEEIKHELDSKAVNVVPWPPVELPTNALRHDRIEIESSRHMMREATSEEHVQSRLA